MQTFLGVIYRNIIKPILFLFPADRVHELMLSFGRVLGAVPPARSLTKMLLRHDDTILTTKVAGITFENPIGLSAGFDYNADLVRILPCVGFGFHTIGTLTHEAYGGNPPPMLGRLPKSRSLLVNKGFKNKGVSAVLAALPPKDGSAVRGVSIGATNKAYGDFTQMIDDLVEGFRDAERFDAFDYYELNISCPNLHNIKNLKVQLASPEGLTTALDALEPLHIKRPILIKMPLERSDEDTLSLVRVAASHPMITGLIFSNLAKDRSNPAFDREEVARAGVGNFSGKPVEQRANELLKLVYRGYHNHFVLVGVGGVFSAEDAYTKIRSGASLVQLISGMIFMGPQVVGEINKGLAALLRRDGFANVRDAVGVDALAS